MKNIAPKFSAYLKAAGVEELPPNFVDHDMDPEKPVRKSQVSGLYRLLTESKWGLYDDAGTGKTLILHAAALYYIQWGNKIIALMPPILFDQFVEAMHTEFPGCEKYAHVLICNSTLRRRKLEKILEKGEDLNMVVITYESFIKYQDLLWNNGFNILIADEAHKLRVAESEFYSSVYNYTDNEDTVLAVSTGTPIFNTPLDGYAMTNLTSRGTYKSLQSFKRLYCDIVYFKIPVRKRSGRRFRARVEKIKGYKNLPTMHAKMYKKARRVRKKDVLSLKDPTIIPVNLKMSASHQKVYSEMANSRMLEMPDGRLLSARLAVQLREALMQIACNPHAYTDKKVDDVLFNMLLEIRQQIEGKLIVYAHHNVTLESLYERLEDETPALVYGGRKRTDSGNRKDIQRFLKDDNCRDLLAHPETAGVGLNLQGVSHTVLFYEPTPIPGMFSQAMDRVLRGGQKNAVTVYLFKLLGTIYPRMVAEMLDRSDQAGIVNCDKSTFRSWVYGDESR